MKLTIRTFKEDDIEVISKAFQKIGWKKPASQYEKYYLEQSKDKRLVLVAFIDNDFAGYLTIVWRSDYPPFRKQNIPEIVDLNVLPKYQRQKIATRLMDKAESVVKQKSNIVGLGVGLLPDYGPAQRMYVSRGFVPDGLGVVYDNKVVSFGQKVIIDHSLEIHFAKQLK